MLLFSNQLGRCACSETYSIVAHVLRADVDLMSFSLLCHRDLFAILSGRLLARANRQASTNEKTSTVIGMTLVGD